MTPPAESDSRKAMLVAQSELERVRMALAVHDIRNAVSPNRGAPASMATALRASTVLKYAVPLFGVRRMSRIVRYATIALTILRVTRAWRRSGN
jgi:hypothetical protein